MIECPICGRETPERHQEKHHLKPTLRRRKNESKETITVCRDCGDALHQFFDNKRLTRELNTLEALLAEPRVITWARWAAKQNGFGICMKTKKKRRTTRSR